MELKIFSGSSYPELTNKVIDYASQEIGQGSSIEGEVYKCFFPNGDPYCQFKSDLRGRDVFLIQPLGNPSHKHLMELLVMIDAAKRGSAERITAVIPYYPGRQDRKVKPRTPITAKLIAKLLETSGVNRVLCLDLHSEQTVGFFDDAKVDNLYAAPIIWQYLWSRPTIFNNIVIVAPDEGAIKRNSKLAKHYKLDFAFISKCRKGDTEVEAENLVGNVSGRNVLIFDDIFESCGTIIEAAKLLKKNGAKDIYAAATHGLFTDIGYNRLREDDLIKEVIVTNSVPVVEEGKIRTVNISSLLGDAVLRIHKNESISSLFKME